jgi:hypothetical protein
MGYWGYGNFEGDEPRDFLADLVAVWERIIDHALAGESREVAAYFGPGAKPRFVPGQDAIHVLVMPTVEVMIAVAERLPCEYLPGPEKESRWTAESLCTFDAGGPDAWDDAGERRRNIAGTFDRLLRAVSERAGERP